MKKSKLVDGVRVVLIAGTAVMWIGCNESGGGAELSGSSTIVGMVEAFEGSPSVGAIRVRVLETDLSTTTADDGLFVISGIPPGQRTLRFEHAGEVANCQVNVPEQAELIMNRIRIRNQEVTCDSVQVRQEPSPDAPDMQVGGDGVLDRDRLRSSQE